MSCCSIVPRFIAAGIAVVAALASRPAYGQADGTLPLVPHALAAAVGVPPAVAAAQADINRGIADRAAAGAPPSWFLVAGASEVPDADFSAGNIGLEIGREILPGGQRAAERAVADAELARMQGELSRATLRADASLIRAASRALIWERIRRRRIAHDSLLTTAEEALRVRFSTGEGRYLDVLRIRTERLRVTAAIAAAQAEVLSGTAVLLGLAADPDHRTTLRTALKAAEDSPDALAGPLPAIPDSDSLAKASPALVLASAGVARAEAEGAREVASRGVQGNVSAGIQRIGQANDGPTLGPKLGVTLTLPFLSRGANDRVRAAADSAGVAAKSHLAAVKAETSARLAEASARYAGAREQVAVYDATLLRGAQSEREVALATYRAGTLSLLELLDFERALADAEIGRLESLLAVAQAWADLLDAQAGTPSPDAPES